MAWPTTAWVDGDLVTAGQLNAMPVKIADVTLGAAAATVDFTAIPQHYAHLDIIAYVRSTAAVATGTLSVLVNTDTTTNYDGQVVSGSAGVVIASEALGNSQMFSLPISGASAPAGVFSLARIRISHYANAVNQKTASAFAGTKSGTSSGGLAVSRHAGFWRSTAAVTTVTLKSFQLAAGSRFTLYGLP